MAQTEAPEQQEEETTDGDESNGGNGNGSGGVGRTAVRAAAIAAVSGATALAAKKAFVDRGSSDDEGDKPERSQKKSKSGNNDVLTSIVGSAWDSARDSLVPMIESAATSAGEYLAQNGPDLVTDTIVPKFIDGFERGRGSDDED